jgi:hypothetical protein
VRSPLKRLFDVYAEGKSVVDDLDISAVEVLDGVLDLRFVAQAGVAKV